MKDIPVSVLRPEQWDKWEVKAFCGKSGDIHLGTTFVKADTEERAKELGKPALRLIGVRALPSDCLRDFDPINCSTACTLLGSGWTLGGNTVSYYAWPRPATVFGVDGDRREAMGAIAKREVLHATVEG